MNAHVTAERRTLHAIAIFEAFKGIVVLVASIGLLGILHHDVRHVIQDLIRYLDMHLAGRYPTVLLHYADILENANLRFLFMLAMGYALIRLVEAYGLWKDLAWGEWVGALSGGLYIPFEIRHFLHKPSVMGAVIFLLMFVWWFSWRYAYTAGAAYRFRYRSSQKQMSHEADQM